MNVHMDNGSAFLTNFGLVPIGGGHGSASNDVLPWLSPELIQAKRKNPTGLNMKAHFTRYTDVYAFGMLLYGKSTLSF